MVKKALESIGNYSTLKLKDRKVLAAEMRGTGARNKGRYTNIPKNFQKFLRMKPGDYLIWMLAPDGKTVHVRKATWEESVMGDDPIGLTAYLNGEEDPTGYDLNQQALIELLSRAPLTPEAMLNLDLVDLFKEEEEDLGEDL